MYVISPLVDRVRDPCDGWEVIVYCNVTDSFAVAAILPEQVSSSLTENDTNPKVKLKGIDTIGVAELPPPPPPPQEVITKIIDKKYNFFIYKKYNKLTKKRGHKPSFYEVLLIKTYI